MATALTLPRLGETVTEGTIIRWLKKEGEFVKKDEPYVEISTAKIETEVPSPISGRIEKILVKEDETVPVDTELARVDETATEAAPAQAPAAAAAAEAAPAPEKPAETPTVVAAEIPQREIPGAPQVAAQKPAEMPVPVPEPKPPEQPPIESGAPEVTKAMPTEAGFISPIVRKLAREHNLDLSAIKGTGAGGRITRQDVEAAIEAQRPVEAPAVPEAAAPPAPTPTPAPEVAPAPTPAAAPAPERVEHPGERIVPMSILRREIAAHMVKSRRTAAHVTAIVEVDMTNVAKQRDQAKSEFKERSGYSLTYLPFVAKAAIEALFKFPMVNASIVDERNMALHDYVNLGIAVAVEEGLIVPVVKHAEELSVIGLAHRIHDLAEKTRENKLSLDDVTGSTFTITNPGSFGSLIQTPIINQPNVAILSLEMIQKRPVVIDDSIVVRQMVYMPLSYDHRLIDGAMASQFLNRVKTNLETWDFTPDLGI